MCLRMGLCLCLASLKTGTPMRSPTPKRKESKRQVLNEQPSYCAWGLGPGLRCMSECPRCPLSFNFHWQPQNEPCRPG
ncbi:hypothetical protein BKA59DRAFT_476930 [Fusarium tricinctum]|uniref:Secreted protein n=1 Tax=Fusarium tricinctum TaxID=61284 RepID=A0A8K0S1N1_9HYPO|nr:hypothetical protein BKA59DRAFT_476930 [Fusarium tricinctum]